MIQGDETANNRLIVFKGEIRVGTLERTESGSLFQYDEGYRKAHDNNERDHWISAHHPLPHAQFRTNGVNLSPFFAGLLPEGIRLKALKVALKTSEDDLFSMLTAVGKDVVGDVWVSILEQPVAEPTFEPVDLAKVSFHKLFEERLYDISKLNPAIAGVQDKISASMISFPLKVREKNKDYILKLQAKEQPNILENEHLFMQLAREVGLLAANTTLVKDKDNASGLLVERFDRTFHRASKQMIKLYQEDACQLLNRYPADKYRVRTAEIATAIESAVSAPIIELAKLVKLVAFSYLIGNGDLHAKNISIGRNWDTGLTTLTRCYDLLSTIPYGDHQMALEFDGRKDNIKRKHFIDFGERLGVRSAVTTQFLDLLVEHSKTWEERIPEIGLEKRKTRQLIDEISKRRNDLT